MVSESWRVSHERSHIREELLEIEVEFTSSVSVFHSIVLIDLEFKIIDLGKMVLERRGEGT